MRREQRLQLSRRSAYDLLKPPYGDFRDAMGSAYVCVGVEAYLGEDHQGAVSPYAAPAHAEDLSGLPPAYMMVGELDLMRDENIAYATRLMQAGVPTELHVYPGAFHGFDGLVPNAAVSVRAVNEYTEALRRGVSLPQRS